MPKPATVTQAELASVIAAYTAVESSILEIRQRVAAGAPVETGALECASRNEPLRLTEGKYYSLFGLEIGPAESPLRAHNTARRRKASHA